MNKGLAIFNVAMSSLIFLFLMTSYFSNDKNSNSSTETNFSDATKENKDTFPQQIKSIQLKDAYSFAGERIPIENFDVRERLERELLVNTYWHSSTTLNIKMAHRFFPIIEPILAEHGIPDDFKYLAVAESNLRNVTSPAGAKGIWQFLANTGRAYGLEINSEVDERYHYHKATEAACKYLQHYYDKLGSWTLAAAAYNMGGPRLERFLEEQRAQNYYDLNLFEETNRYVFRIIALKEIIENSEDFGFLIPEEDRYPAFEQTEWIEIDQPIANLGDFAAEHNLSYRMLKVYNPWLTKGQLSNSRRATYEIMVPVSEGMSSPLAE